MRALPLACLVTLAGCSEKPSQPVMKMTAYDVNEPVAEAYAPPEVAPPAETGDPAPLTVSVPKLAYSYALGFRLPADKVASAQEAHRARCEQMGPARCQLIALQRSDASDAKPDGSLKLRVASSEARQFAADAVKAVSAAGGRAIATKVSAEDVSKDMSDTQARIRQRELLVARLTEILRARNGKVAELVEAERSVAQAQEELDQAKSWLAELSARVAMSDFEISYSAVAPAPAPEGARTLGEAAIDSVATFVIGLRGILTFLIYLLPWAIAAIPLVLLARAAVIRWSRAAGSGMAAPEAPAEAIAGPEPAADG